ncbi:uncharacterized protein K452DRAFT_138597 [Aplosporella prunicola CBS 121167]|uniref:Uncharacterized protein n=1 Tax=Aplosporella prunicola CBS 121167 TaxID=1176127 RepID=A0A6A6AZW7_9PEZI|nr:uncharacterized protein K452DRAFT_138597 [Aplosporella prunicola CBS 121167]KAF2136317.1 hypothetical protein K452DRAFT_138597 [Aplosporella prunicola CBS 121167]
MGVGSRAGELCFFHPQPQLSQRFPCAFLRACRVAETRVQARHARLHHVTGQHQVATLNPLDTTATIFSTISLEPDGQNAKRGTGARALPFAASCHSLNPGVYGACRPPPYQSPSWLPSLTALFGLVCLLFFLSPFWLSVSGKGGV